MSHRLLFPVAFISVLLLLPCTTPAQVPQVADERTIVQEVNANLISGDDARIHHAVETLQKLPEPIMSDILPQLLDPLSAAKQYEAIDSLSLTAVGQKAIDVVLVSTFQKSRVQALLDEGKFDAATIQAKSYYNLAALKDVNGAMALLADCWKRSGKPEMATKFAAQQLAADAPANAAKAENILATINIDAAPYATALTSFQNKAIRRPSVSNSLAMGNLLLLCDKPADARKQFESALSARGNKPKEIRVALEGIARCIKAQDGSAQKANDFILAVRDNPETALPATVSVVDADALRTAAGQTILTPVHELAEPPLEQQRAQEADSGQPAATVATNFEGALQVTTRAVSPSHLELTLPDAPFRSWFMFRVDNVKGRTIRIDLKDPYGQLPNWSTLNPLYSYASDLSDPASFAMGTKGGQVASWNGAKLPDTYNDQWHYAPDVWRVDDHTMAFVIHFEQDKAYVAMRVPYVPSLNEKVLRKIAADHPDVKLVEVGRSRQNRPLLLLEMDPQDNSKGDKPGVLIYAGEHANEFDSMWVASGAIDYLLSGTDEAKRLRERFTFIVIPQLDPDGTSAGELGSIYGGFSAGRLTPEAQAYSTWFEKWTDAGKRLDLTLDLYTPQSRESQQIACALFESTGTRGDLSTAFYRLLVAHLSEAGYLSDREAIPMGKMPWRLSGYLTENFGALGLLFENNSQDPNRHMDLAQIKALGEQLVLSTGDFFDSPQGAALLVSADTARQDYKQRQAALKQATP